jgi:hydroxymethylpyrimidine/phosphomethylpyrimidine kinase
MLSCRATMLAVAGRLKKWKPENIVVDPVMYAKNGCALMEESAIDTLLGEIVPLAHLITPNIPEAEKMTGMAIHSHDDMRQAARRVFNMGCRAVVVKGGHSQGDAVDILFDGTDFFEYPAPRVDTRHTHGTGCTFSAAIAASLALGRTIDEAVSSAKAYINIAIRHAPKLGKGHGPTHHFYDMYARYFGEERL